MHKKTVIIILSVVILSLSIFLIINLSSIPEDKIEKEEEKETEVEEQSDFFLYLESEEFLNPDDFPSYEDFETAIKERKTSNFSPFDLVGLQGTIHRDVQVSVTGQIIDATGKVVEDNIDIKADHEAGSYFPFSWCCFSAPEKDGEYLLEILVGEELITTLDFKVIQ